MGLSVDKAETSGVVCGALLRSMRPHSPGRNEPRVEGASRVVAVMVP